MKKSKKNLGVVESMHVAAARLKVDRHVIRAAKRAGSRAFKKGNRIDLDQLARDLAASQAKKTAADTRKAATHPLPDLREIDQSLKGAILAEEESLNAVQEARKRGDTGALPELTRALAIAQRGRHAAERAVMELQVRRGQLIELDSHKRQLHQAWLPIVNRMRQVPIKASRDLAELLDPAKVGGVVSRLVEEAIGETRTLIAPSTDDERRWAAQWILQTIWGKDGQITTESLEIVDSLRDFVVAELAENKGTKKAG